MSSDEMLFSEQTDKKLAEKVFKQSWKVLIVDDEPSIHEVTVLALDGFEFDGRDIKFLHAFSAEEAVKHINNHSDIAVALIDVVMESEHAGLDLVDTIRKEMKNEILRIVLRTGQPGQAPERSVIREYDINDYKEKTELTSQKLFSVVYTSIRSYRDIAALEANRKGLERVITASTEVYKVRKLSELIHGVLEQIVAVLYLDKDMVFVNFDSIAIEGEKGEARILAGTGQYGEMTGKDPFHELDQELLKVLDMAIENKTIVAHNGYYGIYFSPNDKLDDVLIFSSQHNLNKDSIHLLELFCNNIGIAYMNLLLHKEIEDTQREILYMLGEAIETRSKETGSHVRRVAEYSKLLAQFVGLPDHEVELILYATPLHDFGKIGIPDSVLHKPGKLDNDEWDLMQMHAELGEAMLKKSDREIMKAAAVIAGQHHEKWDGSGYPSKLEGEDIHIYARITALADVFDALGSKRCYKDPWPMDDVMQLIKDESGKHFDPNLVDILCDNLELFHEITKKYPD